MKIKAIQDMTEDELRAYRLKSLERHVRWLEHLYREFYPCPLNKEEDEWEGDANRFACDEYGELSVVPCIDEASNVCWNAYLVDGAFAYDVMNGRFVHLEDESVAIDVHDCYVHDALDVMGDMALDDLKEMGWDTEW